MPLRTCAAAVAPDDVPITRSAASVISMPASASPAMTPIVHACPADPPPPRTSATFLTICPLLQPVDTPVHRDTKTVLHGLCEIGRIETPVWVPDVAPVWLTVPATAGRAGGLLGE